MFPRVLVNFPFLCQFQIFLPEFRSPIPITNHFILGIVRLGIPQNEFRFPSTVNWLSATSIKNRFVVSILTVGLNASNKTHQKGASAQKDELLKRPSNHIQSIK
jgi:hypothetical protein